MLGLAAVAVGAAVEETKQEDESGKRPQTSFEGMIEPNRTLDAADVACLRHEWAWAFGPKVMAEKGLLQQFHFQYLLWWYAGSGFRASRVSAGRRRIGAAGLAIAVGIGAASLGDSCSACWRWSAACRDTSCFR